jgi:hypothetical protein
MSGILHQLNTAITQFVNGGYMDAYTPLFGSQQFPYWFTLQCIWSCYIIRRSCQRQPRTIVNILKQFSVAILMTFPAREIFARIWSQPSPIHTHPVTLAIFAAVFVLITFSPYDIVLKILNIITRPLSFAQAFNVMRFFARMIRVMQPPTDVKKLFVATGLAVLDQMCATVLRGLLSGVETKLSHSLVVTSLVTIAWTAVTQQNVFTKWIGHYDPRLAALVLGFALGVANGASSAATILQTPEAVPEEEDREAAGPESNIIAFKGTHAELMERIAGGADVVVLALWASWHPACRALHTNLPMVAEHTLHRGRSQRE